MFLHILAYERYFIIFLPSKDVSYFIQRSRIDMFKENSTRHFDAKIYSNSSIQFALKKVRLNSFLFQQIISYFASAYSR